MLNTTISIKTMFVLYVSYSQSLESTKMFAYNIVLRY